MPRKFTLLFATSLLIGFVLVRVAPAFAEQASQLSAGASTPPRSILAVKYLDRKGTSIDMVGTAIDRHAKGKADITFEHGRALVKLEMQSLHNPQSLGTFYTTYVLWAIAPEGQATNIAELPVGRAISISATTPFQTFGLIVTAEPHAAVKLPSAMIVAENVLRNHTVGTIESSLVEYRGDPGTYYTVGPSGTGSPNGTLRADFRTPLPLLGARRAVEIARRADAQRFAEPELREAEAKLVGLEHGWPADAGGNARRYEERFGGVARDVTRLAEQARTLAVERAIQVGRQAERNLALSTITLAQAEAARANQAAEMAQKVAQQETQSARAQMAQAQTDAEKAKANEELARAQAEQARVDADQASRERDAVQQHLYASISEILETRREARGLIVNLSDVLFDFDKATLKSGTREKLSKLAGILLAYPGRYHIEVEGHTDAIGSDEYNLALSQQRAESVRACLVEAGVGSEHIVAVHGFGKDCPVATNGTAEGRQLNRRVELVIEDVAPPTR